jgi:hypothetical protein
MITPGVIDINFSEKIFDRRFKSAVEKEINQALVKAKPEVLEYLKRAVKQTLESSPEYYSLIEGDLAFQFGFVKGAEKSYVDPVIDYIINSINTDVVKFKYDVGGGYSINLVVLSVDELSAVGKATYISKPSNEPIEWLNWLLTQGNKIIIDGYRIVIGKIPPDKSRSTKAIMVKKAGASWGLNTASKVPSGLAGTMNNNWVTRAIDLYMGDNSQGIIPFNIMNIIERYLS